MKTLRIFPLVALLMAVSSLAFAQTKTETFKVSGNCGMCKNKIEKAAKEAGAKAATWDVEKKELTVTYNSSSTNTAKIQQKVADVGYDNVGFTATTESYNKLHGCCKYERTSSQTNEAKLPGWMGGSKESSCKEGHEGKACCKKEGDKQLDCCKDGKCTKEGHDGKDCCKKEAMDCCKDGKCTKEGHDGKDCCKKSEQ
jgi:periplasmic mercuric ion binding protein